MTGCRWLVAMIAVWSGLSGAGAVHAADLPPAAQALLQRAGNADDDAARLAILRELGALPGLEAGVRADVATMVKVVERWLTHPKLAYFGGEVKNLDVDLKIPADSPIAPLTWLYRGRMVLAVCLESGNIWGYTDKRQASFDAARGFFERYAAQFPENRIARMYLGEPIPWTKAYPRVEGAPAWAVAQRDSLEGLADIIEWWIDHRQRETGEYGGGWGDDCEMWRWWTPVLIGFESAKIRAAQATFSRAIMDQSHMRQGYTTQMSDVEHTAEDSADAITPMMHLDPDNPEWQARARRLAELMETFWTGRNERGFLQFKSTYFTADQVDPDPRRACDTVYHPRTVQPALLLWQRTRDPQLTALFSAWMDAWVDATARAENGKPAGIVPSAIHWPDGRVGGMAEPWWDPQNHREPGLYRWPTVTSMVTNTLLLTYQITGQEKYLEPIRSMARIRLKYLADPPVEPTAGGEAWCAAQLGFLSETIAKYRVLTGDQSFDALLAGGGSPYMGFRLSGDRAPLETALAGSANAFAYNFAGYTSEVRYTDRVTRLPQVWQGDAILSTPRWKSSTPQPELVYATVTGDPGSPLYCPMNAVRWLTEPRAIAALVVASDQTRLEAELFAFDETPRSMGAEFYLLAPGRYTVTVTDAAGRMISTEPLEVEGARAKATFDLPPRQVCRLSIAP